MTGCWKEKKKKDIGYEAIQKKLLNRRLIKFESTQTNIFSRNHSRISGTVPVPE